MLGGIGLCMGVTGAFGGGVGGGDAVSRVKQRDREMEQRRPMVVRSGGRCRTLLAGGELMPCVSK